MNEREAQYELYRHQPDALRFDKQREVVRDRSELLALFCSRRAGKTEEFAFEVAETLATVRDAHAIFIGLSAKSARQIFFSKFKRLNIAHKWGFVSNEQSLSFTHPATGSTCLVFGSDQRSDIEKAAGLSRVVLLILDECGLWRQDFLRYTIEEIVGPAMEDVPGGRVMLGGTPGRILSGFWYELTHEGKYPQYSRHSWKLRDNPFMPPDVEEKVLKKFGWTRDTPEFRRQYLGEWVIDPSTLVFSNFSDANIRSCPWKPTYGSLLSLDFGVVHSTAFLVLAQYKHHKAVMVPYSEERHGTDVASGTNPTAVADRAKTLKEIYRCSRIIGDLGGIGKAYAQEMLVRHHICIEPADKHDKLALIEMVNDAFGQRKLEIDPSNVELIRQLRTLQWDELHADIAEGQRDDLVDDLCYGYQQTNHVYVAPPEPTDAPVMYKAPARPYWAVDMGAR